MKHKVSELMDGELTNLDAQETIESLKRDNELQQHWEAYHLIGDYIRQPELPLTDVTQRIQQRLESEPVFLKPNPGKPIYRKTKVFAYATAASVVAMVTAWLAMNDVYQQSHPIQVADQSRDHQEMGIERSTAPLFVSHPNTATTFPHVSVDEMDQYLLYHNFQNYRDELPPEAARQGQSVYIYPVTDLHDKYGR